MTQAPWPQPPRGDARARRLAAPRLLVAALALVVASALVPGAESGVVRTAAAQGAGDGPDDAAATRRELDRVRTRIDEGRAEVEDLDRRLAAAADELDRLRGAMLDAAARAQPIEAELTDLTARIAELEATARARESALAERRAAMAGTLAALQRLALRPPATLLVSPGDANDIVRTGLLLRAAVPLIERQAAALRADLDALAALRRDLDQRRARLAAAQAELAAERAKLAALADEKETVLASLGTARSDAAADLDDSLARAADLDALLAALRARARERAAADAATDAAGDGTRDGAVVDMYRLLRPLGGGAGQMAAPAQGRLVRRFGAPDGFGGTHRGVTFETVSGARIYAPWDGQVVFAGRFRDYGLILIIDHGQEYHSLIAGFAEMTAVAGQWVLAGEPLGTTAQQAGPQLSTSDGSDRPVRATDSGPMLYVELRQGGSPVDPLPWLAARNDRPDG